MKIDESDFIELSRIFSSGDVSKSTKAQLERYIVMLSRPTACTHFGELQFPQVCATVRTLLTVRCIEESNRVPLA
nr:hypothetical protein [uncultured Pseudogulbenkiania sp.]